MNEFEKMKDLFFQTIEEKCFGEYKNKAFFHSLSTCTLCQKLAIERDLDLEIASIIGLMHDIGQYISHSSYKHALKSKEFVAYHISNDYKNKDIVFKAIENHSDKEHIHDAYSELLKDADLLSQYLAEPDRVFPAFQQNRIQKSLHKM